MYLQPHWSLSPIWGKMIQPFDEPPLMSLPSQGPGMKFASCLILPLILLSACTGWPPQRKARPVRSEPDLVSSTLSREVTLSRVRYVVVDEWRRDIDTLRDWMGCPSDEVREAVKGWYRDRHESDPDVEKVLELSELLEAPRRRAMKRLETSNENFRAPRLGIPTDDDDR